MREISHVRINELFEHISGIQKLVGKETRSSYFIRNFKNRKLLFEFCARVRHVRLLVLQKVRTLNFDRRALQRSVVRQNQIINESNHFESWEVTSIFKLKGKDACNASKIRTRLHDDSLHMVNVNQSNVFLLSKVSPLSTIIPYHPCFPIIVDFRKTRLLSIWFQPSFKILDFRWWRGVIALTNVKLNACRRYRFNVMSRVCENSTIERVSRVNIFHAR